MAGTMYVEPDVVEMLFGAPQQASDHEDWRYDSDEILNALYNDSDTICMSTELASQDGLRGTNNTIWDLIDGHRDSSSRVPEREHLVEKIETIFETIARALSEESCDGISITLQTRSGLTRRRSNQFGIVHVTPQRKAHEINYPGNSIQETWRFAVVVRILELIHGCLVDNTVMTKRDMYYRHPDLFGKQSVVDQYVDDIACTFGVHRALLNVTATAKGLIAGNFIFRRKDGSVTHGLSEQEDDALDLSSVRWVLVIEKEATFRSLVSSPQWKGLGAHGLILTAKGYPDLASRKFLRLLSDTAPHVPMFALVDYDPDGVAILSTYKYGSCRLAHEDVAYKDTPGLRLPDLQWLGVQSHHMSRTPIDEGGTETAILADLQGLMRLTPRNRKKAQQLLAWDVCGEQGPEIVWRAELQRMLVLNIKAEMQVLDELPGGLVEWLSKKLEGLPGRRAVARGKAPDDEMLF